MTYRFAAPVVGGEMDPDGYWMEAEVSDGVHCGFSLLFQSGGEASEEDDESYWVVTSVPGRDHGCVRTAEMTGPVLRLSLDPSSLPALGLDDAEIEVMCQAPAEDIAQFREVLARVLAHGPEEYRPARIAL
ncbi:hypothetical protein ACGF5F_15405 [Streptomyces sp. NPDC047821]|uniref:hypothetical protein n=1 Tax=Streptomyces sp. NPDC047821 TaxID=3365488 RepID=UPI0037233006